MGREQRGSFDWHDPRRSRKFFLANYDYDYDYDNDGHVAAVCGLTRRVPRAAGAQEQPGCLKTF